MKKKPGESEIPAWRRVPVLRLLTPWMIGIVVADSSDKINQEYLLGFSFLFYLAGIVLYSLKAKYSREWVFGFLLSATWFCCGFAAFTYRFNPADDIPMITGKQVVCLANIADKNSTASGWKLECRLMAVRDASYFLPKAGTFILRADSLSGMQILQIGDEVMLMGIFKPLLPSAVPYGFNYAQTQARKGIYFHCLVKSFCWKLVKKGHVNMISQWISKQRENLENSLNHFIPGIEERAVAVALLVGDDDAIDQDLMRDYAATGTLHVLSVSGMHVGLIYLLIAALLRPIEKRRGGRPIYYLSVIALVWCYAMIAACSPPVLRSALMLTIALMGKWLHRKSALLNSIAISLFILLLWDPSLLFNTGLQLSYLAVTGIVWLQPLIASLFSFQNKIAHWVNEFISVSLAAQLTTCGISLLVFHQFPDLFLFSNMVVIPLTSVAIYASLAVSVLAPFPILAAWAGMITNEIIHLANSIVHKIAALPFAASTGIWISVDDSWLIYVLLFSLVNWLRYKRFLHLTVTLSVVLMLQISAFARLWNQQRRSEIFTYNYARKTVVVCRSGHSQVAVIPHCDPITETKIAGQLKTIAEAGGIRMSLLIKK